MYIRGKSKGVIVMSVLNTLKGIKVEGHKGTWYSIDEYFYCGKHYYIMESEQYGEDAACIAIDAKTHILILDDIWNGTNDLKYYLENELPIYCTKF